MPAVQPAVSQSAIINFTIPAARLGHDADEYMTYKPDRPRPSEGIRVPIVDLRGELEKKRPVIDQIHERGFGIAKVEFEGLDDIPSLEGTKRYLGACCRCVCSWLSVECTNPD
jgi:hypothetical protein